MTRLVKKLFNEPDVPSASQDITTSLSDTEAYRQVCNAASNDYRLFRNFRRDPIYNRFLEHVTQQQGQECLEAIAAEPGIMGAMESFKLNDEYGNPRAFEYPGVGIISPTTLRYIKVLADLKTHFGSLDDLSICEIGVGYGGQCRIINAYCSPARYCLVDIRPALGLAQTYLDHFSLHSVLSYRTMNELAPADYDLVVSNYAFTELHGDLQDVYLERVILRSKRGYITYNEITPAEFRAYKSDELTRIIPKARIVEEKPLTAEKNCIIVWGENSPRND